MKGKSKIRLHLTFDYTVSYKICISCRETGFKAMYLEQFLRVPDEESYAVVQFLNVSLQITCHHLQHEKHGQTN